MDEVENRLRSLGRFPNARNAGDWCRFGDMLAKDINLRSLTWQRLWLKKDIRERGGVAAIWREVFPQEVPFLVQRYGHPSLNFRTNVVYVPYIPQYQPMPANSFSQTPPGSWVGACPPPVPKTAGCASDSAYSGSDDESEEHSDLPKKRTERSASEEASSSELGDESGDKRPAKPKVKESSARAASPSSGPSDEDSKQASVDPNKKTDDRQDLSSRSRSRSPPAARSPKTELERPKRVYSDVWIIAGDDALHPGFVASLAQASKSHGWVMERVKLPTKMVLHTGVALSHVLFCLDSGALGAQVKDSVRMGCVVSEACLKAWPKCNQAAFKSRLDNINHCVRAFGVDGKSTRLLEDEERRRHSHEALLRTSLKRFMILGDGPVGCVDMATYRQRLEWLGKRVLSEESLIEELVFAHLHSPQEAPNGMRLWRNKGGETADMVAEISAQSGTGSNVLVIVLDPMGKPLQPRWS